MKVYEGVNVRNVVVVGHGHAGKTQLISAMLYAAGTTPKLGRVDDGSTTTDFDERPRAEDDNCQRVAYAEWKGTKINFLDTPGFNMFVHEARMAMPAVEGTVVAVDGVGGVEVVTEKTWQFAEEYNLPRVVVGRAWTASAPTPSACWNRP